MRQKQVTKRPEKVQVHNHPQILIADLSKRISDLEKENYSLKAKESEHERAMQAREEVLNRLNETSSFAVAPEKPVGKISITWLDTILNECRRARIVIPEDWTKPEILVKGDEQLGHVTCDEERVQKDISWVNSNGQRIVFLLGDAVDAWVPNHPGMSRENKMGPIAQVGRYIEMHRPIREQIAGYVGGNHERRIDKALQEGGACVKMIAEGLSTETHKVPYSSGILLLDVHWRGHLWTFTLFHGAGAAQTPGSQTQRMQRNMLLSDSTITLSGHLHSENKTSRRYVARTEDGRIKVVKHTSLQCGTYMKYIGSYGEVSGMAPTGPDMIVIELLEDGKYVDRFKGEGN
jgi:hypothetical protein